MPSTAAPARPIVAASLPYQPIPGSLYQVIVWNQQSEIPFDARYFTRATDLEKTVLAGAFQEVSIRVPTGLASPYDHLVLPSIPRRELRETPVYTQDRRRIGHLLQIPAILVHANQILRNLQEDNDQYDYQRAVVSMVKEGARLLAGVLRRGVLRIRQRPGLMGHIIDLPVLAFDEVGIPFQFARDLFRQLKRTYPDLSYSTPWSLDGLPCYTIRFPIANEWGVQKLYLRVIEGEGRCVYLNPWVLDKRFLGDSDGDLAMLLPMIDAIKSGEVFHAQRPRLWIDPEVPAIESQLSLDGLLNPLLLRLDKKQRQRMADPDFHTVEARLQSIEDADTRQAVGTLTTVVGWYCSRVLATANPLDTGVSGPQEATRKAYNALEFLLEQAMDARKADSAFSGKKLDVLALNEILIGGGKLPLEALHQAGMREEDVATLELCWRLSRGNPRRYCEKSPIYKALVINRQRMEGSVIEMLAALYRYGARPEEVYQMIIHDLTGLSPLLLEA